MTPDEPRPWTADAACREVEDPELFFPQGKAGRDSHVLRAGQARAKAICADCPVTRQCLEEALASETYHRFGIWGGKTPEERSDIAAARRRAIS